MIGVFLGAFLGALFGYAANWWHGKQETLARRKVLFRVLSDQLHLIPADDPDDVATTLTIRDTIQVTAVGKLLANNALDATKDETLIRQLIIWQAFERGHNEFVRITNQAQVTMAIPVQHRAAWHHQLDTALGLLRIHRQSVLATLPQEYRLPSWPQGEVSKKDEGISVQYPIDK